MNKAVWGCLVVTICWGCFAASTKADINSSLPLPKSDLLFSDLADGKLDHGSLLTAAAIIANEQRPSALQAIARRQVWLENELRDWAGPNHTVAERTEIVHRFIHERILTGEYQATRNEVSQTLQDGHFNCLTASLLFMTFAKTLDVPAVAFATRTHVFCRVMDREPWDVETTDPNWRPFARDGNSNGVRNLSDRSHARPLNDAELLAKIPYNRGVEAMERSDVETALQEFRRALRIASRDDAARENLVSVLSNSALTAADDGRFELAHRYLIEGLRLQPNHQAIAANDLHIHQRWAEHLCQAGKFSNAVEVLQAGFQRRPDAPLFDRGRIAVYQQWVLELARQGNRDQAMAVADQAIQLLPNAPSLRQLRDDLTNRRL